MTDLHHKTIGQSNATDMDDPRLEALFARARDHQPEKDQWLGMLRAVPRHARNRSRYWRVGGVGFAVIAVVWGLLVFLPPQPQALALSQIVDAMRDVVVVRQTHSNGWVYWDSPGRCYAAQPPEGDDGEYVYRDDIRETIATYRPSRRCVMLSSADTARPPMGLSPQYMLRDLIDVAESWGESFDERWRRIDRSEDGRRVIVLEPRSPQAWLRRVIVDAETGLFLRQETRDGGVEFAYPTEGPRDIYDLGVPNDMPVVDGTAPPDVLALREKVRARAYRGLGAYRAVVVSDDETMRVITDGTRLRVDSIRGSEHDVRSVEALTARAVQFDRMRSLPNLVQSTRIVVGDTETLIEYDDRGVATKRHSRPRPLGFAAFHTLEVLIDHSTSPDVFFGSWGNEQCAVLEPHEQGWGGLSIRGQANRVARPYYRERWYDASHGFVPCYVWSYDDPQAPWQLTDDWKKEYTAYTLGPIKPAADAPAEGSYWRVMRWAELRPGQWYPAVSCHGRMERLADGDWRPLEAAGDDATARFQVIRATPLDSVDEHWFFVAAE